MEDFVSFEQAVQLKALGFDWKTDYMLYVSGDFQKLVSNNEFYGNGLYKLCDEYYYVPSLYEAQKWLRDVKGIDVIVLRYANDYAYKVYSKDMITDTDGLYETYEQALSSGIDQVLQLLTDKTEKK